MTETETQVTAAASSSSAPSGSPELSLRVAQLEADKTALEQELKTLRVLLERAIDYRQKSHSELVLMLTSLVSKLPINDVGAIIAKLLEHNSNLSQYLAALLKGTAEAALPEPAVLKTLEQTKRELAAAAKPLVEELIRLEAPLESDLLHALLAQPESFFAPRMVRANRCFIKGHVSRERVVREYGADALALFNDLTTDPKLNPRPKPDEIVLGFKPDFEELLQQPGPLAPEKKVELMGLYQRVQRSKAPTEQARGQKCAFLKLSFLLELLHYYHHQDTEAPDALFAQRLPSLVEQLVLLEPQDHVDEPALARAESLIAYVINPDHRQMIINNVGKTSTTGKTLKFVLRLRADQTQGPDLDQVLADCVKHLVSAPEGETPSSKKVAAILGLLKPEMQRTVVKAILRSDRLRKDQAEALGKAIGAELGLQGVAEEAKTDEADPLLERQRAWAKIKELIGNRAEASVIATAIRDRLNSKYDAEEIRLSWMALIDADALSIIRVVCRMPYLANGKTDPIARPVLETYVSRLMHEKYAATYHKVLNSLKAMFAARPDSPVLQTFVSLVRWVSPEAAAKLCADIGMPN